MTGLQPECQGESLWEPRTCEAPEEPFLKVAELQWETRVPSRSASLAVHPFIPPVPEP